MGPPVIDVYERCLLGVFQAGVRVERRARVLAGRRSFVSIRTRSVVARDPRPDLYRGRVGDARRTCSNRLRTVSPIEVDTQSTDSFRFTSTLYHAYPRVQGSERRH